MGKTRSLNVARLIDITCVLSPRLAVWPGDEAFTRQSHAREENGHFTDVSVMRTTLHVGTHVDAPAHLLKGGLTIDELELSPFFGPCEVIEVRLPSGERILPEHLGARVRAPRVLFKTDSYPDPERFTQDFNALSPELVRWLQEQGCVLTGLDTPSVDPFDSDHLESHHALFACGLRYLEGLDLRNVRPGLYTLVALPLRIEGGDGSPVRAVLVED
jgi:arylformamidase